MTRNNQNKKIIFVVKYKYQSRLKYVPLKIPIKPLIINNS